MADILGRHRGHVVLSALVIGLIACERPALVMVFASAAAIAVTLGSRGALRMLAAGLVAAALAGAWIGSARLEAIDRSELSALAGREVILRGWVVKRERATGGSAFRLRVTRAGSGPPARRVRGIVRD